MVDCGEQARADTALLLLLPDNLQASCWASALPSTLAAPCLLLLAKCPGKQLT